jgi:hypothetical protein
MSTTFYALDEDGKFGACPKKDLRVRAVLPDGLYYAFGCGYVFGP